MKGMTSVTMKKVGEKCREVLNRAIHDAEMGIIEKHGSISK